MAQLFTDAPYDFAGRIGRIVLRNALELQDIKVVAVNESVEPYLYTFIDRKSVV